MQKTFAGIERDAHNVQEQRATLLLSEEAHENAEQEKFAAEVLKRTIGFFVDLGLDRDAATATITVVPNNEVWNKYFRACFDIDGHLPIMARMVRHDDQVALENRKDIWIISDGGHIEYAATLGDALLISTRLQAENEKWIAQTEKEEAEEETAVETLDLIAEAARCAQLDAVGSLLDQHPGAWKAITLLILYYEM